MIDFLASAGDAVACAGGVDPLVVALIGASLDDAYRHSLSDLTQVAQRGFCSSHLIRRDLQVRLVSQLAHIQAKAYEYVNWCSVYGFTKDTRSR